MFWSQDRNDLEEKLKNLQKDVELQRHNAEAAKASVEKKMKDQVRDFYVEPKAKYNFNKTNFFSLEISNKYFSYL